MNSALSDISTLVAYSVLRQTLAKIWKGFVVVVVVVAIVPWLQIFSIDLEMLKIIYKNVDYF